MAILAAMNIQRPGMLTLVEEPEFAELFIDDLVDSGATRDRYWDRYGEKPLYTLCHKEEEGLNGTWLSFPWERMTKDDGPQDNVRRLLEYIGEDPNREGLLETPNRVVRSYNDLFAGYKQKPEDVIRTFEDGACDEMVVLRGVEMMSCCEHHMLPFYGKAHIAYIPDKRVIGVSKLARILEIYSRRLQIQERLCQQVTRALMDHLQPLGAACVVEAKHLCMVCRGVQKQHSEMVTSSLLGVFRQPEVRAEFFSIIDRG